MVEGEAYNAYVPKPLPPNPPIEMDKVYSYLDRASLALGRLDGLSIMFTDPSLFLYMYIRKEAVLFIENWNHKRDHRKSSK